ncbi:ATP-binding cassette domain-containing protein [uncultured Dokdonia sp.]|uniref:ATP-binding cassette domain-containing protein n=1 Tax=uncultured Dokdonia sp. TaxID=575653 RepID=UPI002607D8AB|nr:ATP-binding cassette domain-containing protein [uncultured Dokdonia sp.]
MKKVLHIQNVSKSFGKKKILKDVSLHFAQGEIVSLFGRNGCGKSTFLKILFGTLKADTIQLQIDSKNIHPKDVIPNQWIGYLPQDNFLPKHLKVRDIIPLFHSDGNNQDRIFRAPFVEKIATRKIGTLSLGELRYLELLLVAHLEHPFLLLDEPFSMIEPLYKEVIKEFLISLTEASPTQVAPKKGILLTDHYYTDVLDISDRNFVMVDGVCQEANTLEDLKHLGYLK